MVGERVGEWVDVDVVVVGERVVVDVVAVVKRSLVTPDFFVLTDELTDLMLLITGGGVVKALTAAKVGEYFLFPMTDSFSPVTEPFPE